MDPNVVIKQENPLDLGEFSLSDPLAIKFVTNDHSATAPRFIMYPDSANTEPHPSEVVQLLRAIHWKMDNLTSEVKDLQQKVSSLRNEFGAKIDEIKNVISSTPAQSHQEPPISIDISDSSQVMSSKPLNFPDNFKCRSFEELQKFNQVLGDYNTANSKYFVNLLQMEFKDCPDFKGYLRKAIGLVMTRDLQRTSTFNKKEGSFNSMICVVLVMATCKKKFQLSAERIKRYLEKYFRNIRFNDKQKLKKQKMENDLFEVGDVDMIE